MRPRIQEEMHQDLVSFEVKAKEREHDEGDNTQVNILRLIGGAKGTYFAYKANSYNRYC
jgi:hypothetical protein